MEALGFDLKYFLFQLLNFGLLFFLLKYLLHKPLLALLDKRKAEIQSGLDNAEKMQVAIAETEESQRLLMEETRAQARLLLDETKAQAQAVESQLREEAVKKASELLERAQAELAAEREEQYRQLRLELTNLVVTATEKVLSNAVSIEEKRKQVEKIVKELA